LIRFCCIVSLINLEMLPDEEVFNPNRSRRELLVSCSPWTCLMQAWM